MSIINLTQHNATPKQKAQGVFDPGPETKNLIRQFLTFNDIPDAKAIKYRAEQLAQIAADVFSVRSEQEGEREAMIGGAPYLMPELETALRQRGIRPVYAFSRREVVEEHQPDGSVVKKAVFRHLGFVRK